MNKRDYEVYQYYSERKQELYKKHIKRYNEDLRKLQGSYNGYMDTIRKVEYIVKNKKSLTSLIMVGFAAVIIELLCWIPFIMTQQGIINHLGNVIPIIFIVFGNFVIITTFVVEVKRDIECYFKYKKLMRE